MALWFVSYATSPITVTIYDVSILIVYDVTLLLSMTYHFQNRLGKTNCTDIWVIKLSPSIGFRVPHCRNKSGRDAIHLISLYHNYMKTKCVLSKWIRAYNFVPMRIFKILIFENQKSHRKVAQFDAGRWYTPY